MCVSDEISQTDGEMHCGRGCRKHCWIGYDQSCCDMTACQVIGWNDVSGCPLVIFLFWDFCHLWEHLCYLCGVWQVSETFSSIQACVLVLAAAIVAGLSLSWTLAWGVEVATLAAVGVGIEDIHMHQGDS